MSLQGGGAREWREGLGRHRWVHFLEALCSVQDDWEEIPRAPSSPVTCRSPGIQFVTLASPSLFLSKAKLPSLHCRAVPRPAGSFWVWSRIAGRTCHF